MIKVVCNITNVMKQDNNIMNENSITMKAT